MEGFEAAAAFVLPEDMQGSIAADPDGEQHVKLIGQYVEAGFDHVVLTCPGDDQAGFIDFFARELKPRLAELG